MIAEDEDALICDFAETYHIYDYRSLPARKAAIFAVGLRENSRIKLRITGQREIRAEVLLALLVDRLGSLLFASSDSEGRQASVVEYLLGGETEHAAGTPESFDTSEDFEEARKRILEGVYKNAE